MMEPETNRGSTVQLLLGCDDLPGPALEVWEGLDPAQRAEVVAVLARLMSKTFDPEGGEEGASDDNQDHCLGALFLRRGIGEPPTGDGRAGRQPPINAT
jgi:hypothetical protein